MAPTPTARGTSGAAQDRMAGRVLGGRYRVLSRLGEGGMGTVFLCEHAVLGRRYAVKVLRPELTADAELAGRFRNEAIAASRVGGAHVVDVLDFGVEPDGALYYVMEALEGRSLGALIAEDGPVEVGRALDLLEQLCRALAAAHRRGVVHRDVKPDNVFVVRGAGGGEQVKVIDFGISQVPPDGDDARITRAGEIIGTPEYMAPEQANGERVDHRADVYALGVLAYELLTGTLPIVAHTPVATLVAHQTRAPEPPSRRRPEVTPAVDALVLRALAKRPEDRYPTMDAFAAAIAAVRAAPARGPERTLVRPRADTVALPELVRAPGKGRGIAVAVGLAVVVIAGVVGVVLATTAGRPTATPDTVRDTATPAVTSTSTTTTTPRPTATATTSPTATRRRATRAPAAQPPPADAHLDDPYGPAPGAPSPR